MVLEPISYPLIRYQMLRASEVCNLINVTLLIIYSYIKHLILLTNIVFPILSFLAKHKLFLTQPPHWLTSPWIVSKVPLFDPKGQFRCEQCNNVYSHRKSLVRHVRQECGKEPQFQCPFCNHRTKLHCNMLKHIRKCQSKLPTTRM